MSQAQLLQDVDPFIAERVVAIRDRFGLRGLKTAYQLIEMEIAIFDETPDAPAERDQSGDR